jgi:hypothetical protein
MRLWRCHRALTVGLLVSRIWLTGQDLEAQEQRYEERTNG